MAAKTRNTKKFPLAPKSKIAAMTVAPRAILRRSSILWIAISPIPIRAEKPNDQPGGEPGEQDAQSYRDKRLHNKYSKNISLSWMYSICRVDEELESDR